MSTLVTLVQQWVDDLRRRDIRATADPRNANPPCLLFLPPTVTRDGNCSAYVEFEALALVPPPGNLDAWAALDDLVRKVIEADLFDVRTVTPASYGVDDANALPALTLAWTAQTDYP